MKVILAVYLKRLLEYLLLNIVFKFLTSVLFSI